MKNQQIVSAWNKINPNEDAQRRMLNNIRRKSCSWPADKKPLFKNRSALAAITISVAVFLTAALLYLPSFLQRGRIISLPRSGKGVCVQYIQEAPLSTNQLSDLAWMTEEDLLSWRNPVIFRGSVLEIHNIQLDFNGSVSYRAIAKIHVERIYRGESELTGLTDRADGTVTLLLPCPIQSGIWIEDTELASALRTGMEGIFMPVLYSETDSWTENGASLCLQDLADCGLLDGERYLFLDTGEELLFADWAYPSLSQAQSLEEIGSYMEKVA